MSFIGGIIDAKIKGALFNRVKNMIKGAKFVRETEIVIGIPEGKNAAHAGGMTNAELLYIHCNGSPAHNIPPRNVLKRGLNDKGTQKQMKSMMKHAMRQAILGNVDAAQAEYEKIGMIGVNAVRAQFGTIPPPLKPATIARKGSSATLIDTGALRQAITYAVRNKGGGGSEGSEMVYSVGGEK